MVSTICVEKWAPDVFVSYIYNTTDLVIINTNVVIIKIPAQTICANAHCHKTKEYKYRGRRSDFVIKDNI